MCAYPCPLSGPNPFSFAEVTISFELKEYIVEEGANTSVCLQFDEMVQRSFEANVTRQPLVDVLDGKDFDVIYVHCVHREVCRLHD